MTRFLRRYKNVIWVSTTVAMLLSIVGVGGFYFTSRDYSDSVAVVGGIKIPYVYYRGLVDRTLERLRKSNKTVSDDLAKEVRREVFQNLVATDLCALEAEALGLRVSDEELSWDIRQDPMFQAGGAFNQGLYVQMVLQGFNATVEDYELQRRRELAARKYQAFVFNSVKLVPSEAREEFKRSHNGSDKGFDKEREDFARNLHRIRALSALQAALRKTAGLLEVRSFLDEREQGAS